MGIGYRNSSVAYHIYMYGLYKCAFTFLNRVELPQQSSLHSEVMELQDIRWKSLIQELGKSLQQVSLKMKCLSKLFLHAQYSLFLNE